jgi:hypothetical protein
MLPDLTVMQIPSFIGGSLPGTHRGFVVRNVKSLKASNSAYLIRPKDFG